MISRITVISFALVTSGALAAGPKAPDGTWSSERCGTRGYERRITFATDGTFSAEDRVSPCPAGVACVWSGVINRNGTYTLKGSTIRLKLEAPAPGAKAEDLPATLSWKKGALAERQAGHTCAYRPFSQPLP
jgi:hypothetical protein